MTILGSLLNAPGIWKFSLFWLIEFSPYCPSVVLCPASKSFTLWMYRLVFSEEKNNNPVQISRNLSLCSYLFSGTLLHEFQLPQFLHILTSVSSIQQIHCTLIGYFLPRSWFRSTSKLKARMIARFVCFCSLRDHNPLLPIDQCGK